MPAEQPSWYSPPCAKHAGNVDQRFHLRHINQGDEFLLAAMAKQIVKQTRLRRFYQLRHGNRGIDIGHGVVGIAVFNAVCARQVFQPEAG